jgi:hypothetical protein
VLSPNRGIPVLNAVVASAIVAKEAVFLANNERNESELILDPDRLQDLTLRTID